LLGWRPKSRMSSDRRAGQRVKDLVDEALTPSATGVLEGQTIGPYQIGPRVGAGGMGEVYKAFDTRLERTVAIKVLLSELAEDATSIARLTASAP